MEQASMCAHISMLDQFAKDFNDSSSIYSMGSRQALAKKVLLLCSPHQMFVFFSYYTTWVSRVACANFLDTFRLRRTNNYHGVVSLVYDIINFYRI